MRLNENMTEMKKVTIMIPTYNQSLYIEQCIDSALAQDYPSLEVIISDDSTNNDTEKIVKEKYLCDSRVKYFHNIPALGRVGNYHKTLYERASGDYVLNMDGDDFLTDNTYISSATEILNLNNEVSCVFARVNIFNEKENFFVNKGDDGNVCFKSILTDTEFFYIYATEITSLNHLTLLYRRDMAIKVGFYEKDIIFSDGYSFAKIIYNSKLAYIHKVVASWRDHGNNASTALTSRINNGNFYTINEILELQELIIELYKGKTFEAFAYEKWAMQYRLAVLYPYFSRLAKQKKLNACFVFMAKLYRYDKFLLLQFSLYASKNIFTYSRKIFGIFIYGGMLAKFTKRRTEG